MVLDNNSSDATPAIVGQLAADDNFFSLQVAHIVWGVQ
jgi:hypothetical protein